MAQWLIVAISAFWVVHFIGFLITIRVMVDPMTIRLSTAGSSTLLLFIPFTIIWGSYLAFG